MPLEYSPIKKGSVNVSRIFLLRKKAVHQSLKRGPSKLSDILIKRVSNIFISICQIYLIYASIFVPITKHAIYIIAASASNLQKWMLNFFHKVDYHL